MPGTRRHHHHVHVVELDAREWNEPRFRKANRCVRLYGLRLLPALYEVYNLMPCEAAREMEVELAIALRAAGHGVWQA